MKKKIKNIIHGILKLVKEKEMYPIPKVMNRDKILEGKVALITGGSGGIGFAIAKSFVESGCKVIITGTNEEKLKENCKKLGGGVNSKYMVWNILETKNISNKLEEALEKFEEKRIDILVNSAGIVAKHSFREITEKEYDTIMDTNAKGTFFMSQAVGEYMIKNKIKGHILNVTSSSALRPAWTPYQMSKWAVRGFTLGLADVLLPYGIVVNAIAPGPVATPMLDKKEGESIYNESSPSGRYAVPSEIAELAVFMVSDLGNLIVGDTFYITGGSGTISYHN